jgi:hypothetical protein
MIGMGLRDYHTPVEVTKYFVRLMRLRNDREALNSIKPQILSASGVLA